MVVIDNLDVGKDKVVESRKVRRNAYTHTAGSSPAN